MPPDRPRVANPWEGVQLPRIHAVSRSSVPSVRRSAWLAIARNSRLLAVSTLLVAGVLVAASGARATVIYNLTSDHCTGGCGTAPFGDVTLTQTGTTVDVSVHLNSPNWFVKTSSADNEAFKFNALDVVLGDIAVDVHIPGLTADAGAFNGDGTGNFGFGISCPTCGGGASDKFNNDIVFHVANATIADLTVPNNLGNVFVADLLSNGPQGGTGNTGPVDATVPVPEPSTAMLLGLGLVGLVYRRNR